MRRLKPLWITLAALTGVFSAISITGYTFIKSQGFETQLNSYLNAKTFKKVEDESTKDEDAEYFKSAYTDEELQKHEKEVCENLVSEGAVLTKKMVEPEVRAIQSKGVNVYTKHFALNDQEWGRMGLSTWSNEQAIREIYLRGFEGNALIDSSGVMTSFNCIGVVWACAHYGLLTEVLRKEWGAKGAAITDCSMFAGFMDQAAGIRAGQDLFDGMSSQNEVNAFVSTYSGDPVMMNAVLRATKKICYSLSHSVAMNGLSSSTRIIPIEPYYMVALKGLAIGNGVGFVIFFALIFLSRLWAKPKAVLENQPAEDKK